MAFLFDQSSEKNKYTKTNRKERVLKKVKIDLFQKSNYLSDPAKENLWKSFVL